MLNNEFTLLLQGKQYSGTIGTISLGGAYLREINPGMTEELLFQDCEITLKLAGVLVLAQCSISFVGAGHSKHAPGVGIAFTEIDGQSALALKHYVEHVQPTFELQHQVTDNK